MPSTPVAGITYGVLPADWTGCLPVSESTRSSCSTRNLAGSMAGPEPRSSNADDGFFAVLAAPTEVMTGPTPERDVMSGSPASDLPATTSTSGAPGLAGRPNSRGRT